MKKLLLLLSVSFVLGSCKKDNANPAQEITCDCDALKNGIMSDNAELVKTEINQLCAGLNPSVTAADEYGHIQNLPLLAQRIAGECGVKATVVCYACIETLPVQSEIRVTFDQNGMTYNRVLDIKTSEQSVLSCLGMHE